jgi:hypothetical protein
MPFYFHGYIVREFRRTVNADTLEEAMEMYEDTPRQIIQEGFKSKEEVLFDVTDNDGEVVWEKEEDDSNHSEGCG